MIDAILCFGSNLHPELSILNIEKSKQMLEDHGCEFMDWTDIYLSSSGYYNMVAHMRSPFGDLEALNIECKQIEHALGRTPEMKANGIVPIDIDVVIYADKVIRVQDYNSAYFKNGYSVLLKGEKALKRDQKQRNAKKNS